MPDLLAEVNERVRELAEREPHGAEEWGFHCECGQEDCGKYVSLSLPEYEQLRESGTPILADDHLPARYRTARTRASELRDESTALRQQAQHQANRARRAIEGSVRRMELVCTSCGYVVSVEQPPDRCPICGDWAWHRRSRP